MSKAALKKELISMSHDQLAQIILDAYEVNAEVKEYFEFFLNPDVEKLFNKIDDGFRKELSKSKWGYSKAKSTVLKKLVKKFRGFNPPIDWIIKLKKTVILRIGATERYVDLKEPLFNFVKYEVKQLLLIGEKYRLFDTIMKSLGEIMEDEQLTPYFRRHISEAIDEFA